MERCRGMLGAVLLVAGLMAARGAHAESSIVLPRAGQVGIGLQGGYGLMLDSGNLGKVFDVGPTFAVRLRYRMRYERGLGLSFESQRLEAREDPGTFVVGDESTVGPEHLSLIASGVEFYQMFDTRSRTTKMVMVGVGFAQARPELNTGETQISGGESGDGPYVSLGAGLERFVYRSAAWDFSVRYLAIFKDGEANHDVQIALGAILYAGY